jgi:hypothetical protein
LKEARCQKLRLMCTLIYVVQQKVEKIRIKH